MYGKNSEGIKKIVSCLNYLKLKTGVKKLPSKFFYPLGLIKIAQAKN